MSKIPTLIEGDKNLFRVTYNLSYLGEKQLIWGTNEFVCLKCLPSCINILEFRIIFQK